MVSNKSNAPAANFLKRIENAEAREMVKAFLALGVAAVVFDKQTGKHLLCVVGENEARFFELNQVGLKLVRIQPNRTT